MSGSAGLNSKDSKSPSRADQYGSTSKSIIAKQQPKARRSIKHRRQVKKRERNVARNDRKIGDKGKKKSQKIRLSVNLLNAIQEKSTVWLRN